MSLVSLTLGDYLVLQEVSTWENPHNCWGAGTEGSPTFFLSVSMWGLLMLLKEE